MEDPNIQIVARKPIVLEGHVNCVRKGMAYLTLIGQNRLGSFAECSLDTLKADGIVDKFEITISRDKPHTLTLRSGKKERQLAPGEWGHISETVSCALYSSRSEDGYE
jgi:hypothetical protein